ncbi:hypothetical protein [Pedobacter endophyticus]|nr:hypothetical protein [Pedobacter endophyticus]
MSYFWLLENSTDSAQEVVIAPHGSFDVVTAKVNKIIFIALVA